MITSVITQPNDIKLLYLGLQILNKIARHNDVVRIYVYVMVLKIGTPIV